MKLYMFYINKKKCMDAILASDMIIAGNTEVGNKNMVLYAITNSKKRMEEFKKQRTNKFEIIKKEIDDNDYSSIKKKYKDYFIKNIEYCHYNDGHLKYINILSTNNEYKACSTYWFDNMIDISTFNNFNGDLLNNINKKYLKILEDIKFLDLYKIFNDNYEYPNDEDFDIFEEDIYTTVSKVVIENGENVVYSVNMLRDELNIFISIFTSTLK